MHHDHCALFVSDCHVRAGAELVSHTWDPVVLSALRERPTRRSVLLTRVAGVSDKALTEALRRLVDRGLIARTHDAAGRGTAEYGLTDLGESFAKGPLHQLARWVADNHSALTSTT